MPKDTSPSTSPIVEDSQNSPEPVPPEHKTMKALPNKIKDPRNPVERTLHAPFYVANNFWRWGSSNRGSRLFFSIVQTYCAALGVEALVVAVPPQLPEGVSQWNSDRLEEVNRSRRFVPKFSVDDGAKLSRVNPLPVIANSLNGFLLSDLGSLELEDGSYVAQQGDKGLDSIRKSLRVTPSATNPASDTAVFDVSDNLFNTEPTTLILAVIGCLLIQHIESVPFRQKKLEKLREKFDKINSQKKAKPHSDAIPLASVKAAEVNSYGLGGVAAKALFIAVVYGIELLAFVRSFAYGTPGGVKALYMFLTVFGFEVCDKINNPSTTPEKQ